METEKNLKCALHGGVNFFRKTGHHNIQMSGVLESKTTFLLGRSADAEGFCHAAPWDLQIDNNVTSRATNTLKNFRQDTTSFFSDQTL